MSAHDWFERHGREKLSDAPTVAHSFSRSSRTSCTREGRTPHASRNKAVGNDNVLALFDFDKTLIRTDSFRLFAWICATSASDCLCVLASTVLCKAGILSNGQYKRYLLRQVWFSRSSEVRASLLNRFYRRIQKEQNPVVVGRLYGHLRAGHTVVILSASPEFYLKPLVYSLFERIQVFGSRVTHVDSRAELANLSGELKAERARSLIQEMKPNGVYVYTDHQSDLPLLRLADRAILVRPRRALVREVQGLGIKLEIIE